MAGRFASWWNRKTHGESSLHFGDAVRIHVDRRADAMTIAFSDRPVEQTVEIPEGLVDLDAEGNVVAVEIFAFSTLPERTSLDPRVPSLERELSAAVRRYADDAQRHESITR